MTDAIDIMMDVTGQTVLWITGEGNFFGVATSGAQSKGTLLATTGTTLNRMARDASFVYATGTNGSIYAASLSSSTGGAARVLASGEKSPFGIAADGARVYWTTSNGQVRAVSAP